MSFKSLDIIVLGATGFTGKCVVKYLANITKNIYCDITWGMSGRSLEKVYDLVHELDNLGLNIKNIPILECDIYNQESLCEVLRAARIVVNCTGPNTLLSLPIVKTCIETGTHYIDISAEMYHILTTYRDCNKAAEDANVLVIPACGFAVIPSETAMIYLDRHFKGTLHTVECYIEIILPKDVYIGQTLVHNGTWTSLVHVLDKFKEHMALFKQMFPNISESEPEEMKRSFFHLHNGRIWFPFPGPDNALAQITQTNLYKKIQKKPTHIKIYTTMPKLFHFCIIPVMFLYYYLSYFGFFQKLLINFPRFFTIGHFSQKGPTEKTRNDTKFSMILNAKGWDLNASLQSKPNKTMSVKVSGSDPGYNTTAIAIVMCAITVLKERSNMPKGGVLMPGEAFYKTNLVERLMGNGYTYEVVDNLDKKNAKI